MWLPPFYAFFAFFLPAALGGSLLLCNVVYHGLGGGAAVRNGRAHAVSAYGMGSRELESVDKVIGLFHLEPCYSMVVNAV